VLGEVQARLEDALCSVLGAGNAAGLWTLADPEATSTRLGALHDGLAGLLLSGPQRLTRAAAEAHLRHLFTLECAG
jgi:BetI-type transcriptional repressor, C-terminal